MGSPPYKQPSIHHTDFKDKEKCVSFESIKGKEVPTHRCTRKPLWALAKNQYGQAERDELIEDLIGTSQKMSQVTIVQKTEELAEVSMCSQCGQNYQRVQEVARMITDNLVSFAKPTPRPVKHAFTPLAPLRIFDGLLPTPQSSRHGTPTPIFPNAPVFPPTPASSITYGRRSPSPSPAPSHSSQDNPFQRSQGRKTSHRPGPAPATPTPHPIFGDTLKNEGGFSNENVFQNSSNGKAKTKPTPNSSPTPKTEPADASFSQSKPPVSLLNVLSRADLATKVQTLERQLDSIKKEFNPKNEEIAILRREKSDLGLQVKTLNRKIQTMSKVMAEFLNGLGAGVQSVTENLHQAYVEEASDQDGEEL